MNDIGWQNSFKSQVSQRSVQGGRGKSSSGSPSFASQFLSGPTGHKASSELFDASTTFRQRYVGTGGSRHANPSYGRPGEPRYQHQPVFSGNAPHAAQNGGQNPQWNTTASQTSPSGFVNGPVHSPASSTVPPQRPTDDLLAQTSPNLSPWYFLDLKNKKQTGDLHKKILSYTKKNAHKVFCFTSSHSGEGVTTVLANLADYIRTNAGEKKVLIIDACLRAPGLQQVFNSPGQNFGMIDVLTKRARVRDVLKPLGGNLWFMGTGDIRNYSDGIMGVENFALMLNECRQLTDCILIDCPPALISSDSLTIAPMADITFMVVQAVKVHRQVALKSLSLLQENECEIGGVILNRVQQVIPGWVYRFL